MSKRDEPKKLGKNGVDMGDRGVYDISVPHIRGRCVQFEKFLLKYKK